VTQNTVKDKEPGWLQDRVSLLVYRLRAAWCGLKIFRLAHPSFEVISYIGVLATIISLALAIYLGMNQSLGDVVRFVAKITEGLPLAALGEYTPWVGATIFAAALWLAIRYLGHLPRMMDIAASSSDGAAKIRENMAEGMKNAHAYEQLRKLYEEPLKAANDQLKSKGSQEGFEFVQMSNPPHGSHHYAAIVLPLTKPTTLENLLEAIKANTPKRYQQFSQTAEARQELYEKWQQARHSAHGPSDYESGDNYHLLETRINNESGSPRIVLDVGIATYGQIVRTCDALINEFALFAYITRSTRLRMRSRSFLHCLPWRRKTHEQERHLEDIFLHSCGRAAGLGIAVATIIVNEARDYMVALGMRSAAVGTYPDCLHVIPAGMCNTKGTDKVGGTKRSTVPDWFVRTTMRSEFQEEWYADEDLEEGRIVHWQQYVDSGWEKLIGDKPIILTGLAYDLLNLRPEICGVVEVDEWGDKLCWEYIQNQPHEERLLAEVGSEEPTNIVQSGAAVLFLAQRMMLSGNGKAV